MNNVKELSVKEPISICIPRVDNIYDKSYIYNIFNSCQLGTIDRVDIVPNHKEVGKYNRVFIHFSEMTNYFHLKRLNKGLSIKIVYDGPWYWKCVHSRVQQKIYKSKIYISKNK